MFCEGWISEETLERSNLQLSFKLCIVVVDFLFVLDVFFFFFFLEKKKAFDFTASISTSVEFDLNITRSA